MPITPTTINSRVRRIVVAAAAAIALLTAVFAAGAQADLNYYYYSWSLTKATSARTPSAVLSALTNKLSVWPFSIHWQTYPYTVHAPGAISGVGGSASNLRAGYVYSISEGPTSNPIYVGYAGMQNGTAVLDFRSLPGHSEGTNSTIRFSSWVSGGWLRFDVTGYDTFNYEGVPNSWLWDLTWGNGAHAADIWAVPGLWNNLQASLQRVIKSIPATSPTPPAPPTPPTPPPAPPSLPPPPPYYVYQVYGTCADGGCGLHERTGPGYSSFPSVGMLYDGEAVDIVCQTTGELLTPNHGTASTVWDRLTNGFYVTDVYVDTPGVGGAFSPPIPTC
jgi:hypothetical protein